MAKLSAILDQVDAGTVLLPEFQRGYVWNRDQVRGLMRSLYKGYPIGALLVWETDAAHQAVRGAAAATGTRSLLLDGQQRVTTLYGVVRGTPPAFFEGDLEAFRNLRFNVETEAFEFYGPVKMKDDPLWVDVTALFVDGPSAVASGLRGHPTFFDFVDRLHRGVHQGGAIAGALQERGGPCHRQGLVAQLVAGHQQDVAGLAHEAQSTPAVRGGPPGARTSRSRRW